MAPLKRATGGVGKPLQIAARSDKVAKVHFWTFGSERIPTSRVMYLGVTTARGKRDARQADQPQKENFMGGLYLGLAVTSVEALVAMGLVIAFI